MEYKEKVVIEVPLSSDTLTKVKRIVEFENIKNDIKGKNRKYRTEVDFIRSSIMESIIKFETYNHLITLDTDKSIGNSRYELKNRLKEVLKEKGLKQLDLADLTGIDRSSISLFVNNRNQPAADYLLRIWVALDFYPLDKLFYRVESR